MARSGSKTALFALLLLVCVVATHATEACASNGLGGILTRLRGGSEQAAASQAGSEGTATEAEDAAAKAQAYINEQMEYWNSLTKEQQEEMLSKMDPQQRAQTEAFLAGKPQLTITEESLKVWNSMSPEDQEAQLKNMSPEQQEALKEAVAGKRATVAVGAN